MLTSPLVLADVVAIALLVFGLFWRRDGRRELVVAFLTVNVGVLAVTAALSDGTVGAGLGLGLFGILSIIRLRSEELTQREVAYYFAALALGLLGGLTITSTLLGIALMTAILAAVAIGDHPRIAGRTVSQEMVLDQAWTDPAEATARVRTLTGIPTATATVVRVDLVNDTTLVVARYRPEDRPAVRDAPAEDTAPALADTSSLYLERSAR
ncbi:DUF4956 domain-containing protein [Nocardioides sambongensis]|uniref:DUF4956 domain-containing protein n=1 Tax=Nocardioides sambongensis TaxID=2589074 RepID=UPI001128BD33|nr:DUF4956 domain-containing protein [Nocardioides sambongensis]